MQAMSCMHLGVKKPATIQEISGKPFLGTTRPYELSKGIEGYFDLNLSCQYCKDTSHELENCRQFQRKLAHDHLATQGIVAQEHLMVIKFRIHQNPNVM